MLRMEKIIDTKELNISIPPIKITGEVGLIAIAMSGGVDSSVAAAILAKAGYPVVGVTMKLWDAGRSGELNDKTCCTLDSSMDARRVCDQLGIPHYTLDMTEDFEERVMEPFYQAYLEAKTPNPCVNCNSFVKWDALWNRVKSIGATHLATGHYAETSSDDGQIYITRGQDSSKDQSYFLWGIPPETLQHTIFPMTGLSKPEVREVARFYDLKTAEKKESMDICFIPDGNKDAFIQKRAAERNDIFEPGKIVGPEGQKIGNHNGLPFYTIGQRKGLGIATGEPLFVKKIDRATNTLMLGRKDDLLGQRFSATKVNWFLPAKNSAQEGLTVQVRYRSKAIECKVEFTSETDLIVTLELETLSITPGQSAVFYLGDRVVGGAIIAEPLPVLAPANEIDSDSEIVKDA